MNMEELGKMAREGHLKLKEVGDKSKLVDEVSIGAAPLAKKMVNELISQFNDFSLDQIAKMSDKVEKAEHKISAVVQIAVDKHTKLTKQLETSEIKIEDFIHTTERTIKQQQDELLNRVEFDAKELQKHISKTQKEIGELYSDTLDTCNQVKSYGVTAKTVIDNVVEAGKKKLEDEFEQMKVDMACYVAEHIVKNFGRIILDWIRSKFKK